MQLSRPLFAQGGRRQDDHADRGVAPDQFRDDQPGLYRLAESDLVGNEQPRSAGEHRQRRFQLVRKNVGRGVDGGRWHAHVVGARDEMRQARERFLRPDAPRGRRAGARERAVER